MSDTPRTDAAEGDAFIGTHGCFDPDDIICAYDFSRQLERELAAANERIKRLEYAVAWQPIETAPTDMTWVIGYDARDGEVGTIIFDRVVDVEDHDAQYEWTDGIRAWNPTHWMPIPDPPKSKHTNQ